MLYHTSALLIVATLLFGGCVSGGMYLHNDNGSEPMNETERLLYKRAVLKCYKTGGNRVVKIQGELKCY